MSVRAKVRCNAKTSSEVHFTTVYEPDEAKDKENARFTKATPWGDIRMGIDNPAAMEQFKVNEEYYVDFHPVPKPGLPPASSSEIGAHNANPSIE